MKSKRIISALLSISIIAAVFPVVTLAAETEQKVYLSEGFGGYPTNIHSIDDYTIVGEKKFKITEIGDMNKAAYFDAAAGTSLTKSFDEKISDKHIVLSLGVRSYDKPAKFNVSFMSGTASYKVISVSEGSVVLDDGKKLDGLIPGRVTKIDVVLDNSKGRACVYIDGRRCASDWKLAGTKKSTYDAVCVQQESDSSPFGLDYIAVYTGEVPDSKFAEKGMYSGETRSELFIDQDPSDFTYFHSQHIANAKATYNFSLFEAKEGNSYVAERLDYKNPEKGNRIILTKNNDDSAYTDVYVQTSFKSRINTLPAGRIYKNFLVEGDLTITTPTVGGQLYMMRDVTSGSYADFSFIPMSNGTIFGKTLEPDRKYHIGCYINLTTHLYDLYIDGELITQDAAIREDLNTPTIMRINLCSGQGSWIIENWEVTGLAKPVERITGENGMPEPKITHSSQFPDESVIENYLADKIVFHGEANTLYKDNTKIPLTEQSVYENNELYIAPADFKAAYGVELTYNAESKVYKSGNKSYTAAEPIVRNGAELIPAKALSNAIGWYAKHSGYGSMIIASKDKADLIETSDKEMPWFDIQFYSTAGNYPITSFTDAQEISNLIFFDRPTAAQLEADFKETLGETPAHPRLLVNAEKVEQMRALTKTDSYYKEISDRYLENSEQYLTAAEPQYKFDDSMRTKNNAESIVKGLLAMAASYLVTGDKKYSDRAIADMMKIAAFPDLNETHIIDTGVWLRGLSFAYDWCYTEMTDEERQAISECILKSVRIVRRAFYATLSSSGDGTGFQAASAFPRWKSNYTAFVTGGLVPACLAVAEKDPENCFDTLEKSFRAWEYMLFGLYPGGVWLEGKVYQTVLVNCMAHACGSLMSCLGSTYKILEYPGVNESFYAMMSYGSLTASFSFADDTGRAPLSGIGAGYSFYSEYYDDDVLGMWRKMAFKNSVADKYYNPTGNVDMMDLIYYRPPVSESVFSDFNNVNVFDGGEIFTLHEDWLDKDATFFATAGGPTRCYHQHNDGGDFIFCQNGEMWTYEFGQGDYNVGSIYNRFSGRSDAHNTITLNPDNNFSQKEQSYAPIVKWEEGPGGAYVVYDMTELYEDHGAEKMIRGFYIDEDYNTLTIRDEMELSKRTTGYWSLHTDANIYKISDNEILMTKNRKQMVMTINCDTEDFTCTIETGKSRPLPGSPSLQSDNTAKTDINRILVSFVGQGKLNITAKMSESPKAPELTPISEWKAPTGTAAEKIGNIDFSYDIVADGKKIEGDAIIPVADEKNLPEFEIVPRNSGVTAEFTATDKLEEPMLVKLTDTATLTVRYAIVRYSKYGEAVVNAAYDIVDVKAYEVSSEPEPANTKEHIFDNDFLTRYTSFGDGENVVFDLGEPKLVDAVTMGFWKGDQRNYFFDIQTSTDGVNYKRVGEYTSSGLTETYEIFKFPAEMVRYIKFVGHENSVNNANNILEFRALKSK